MDNKPRMDGEKGWVMAYRVKLVIEIAVMSPIIPVPWLSFIADLHLIQA
jgi:hypothetical protein